MHPQFRQLLKHRIKFNLFLIKNLPAAWFSGVRLVNCTDESCTVKVPYQWFTTNPFGSTYFACLAMAAEMSTGILALGNIYGRNPPVSMLVRSLQADFLKKATGVTSFTCEAGSAISAAIQRAITEKAPQEVTARATGTNEKGELVAVFSITWGFREKS